MCNQQKFEKCCMGVSNQSYIKFEILAPKNTCESKSNYIATNNVSKWTFVPCISIKLWQKKITCDSKGKQIGTPPSMHAE